MKNRRFPKTSGFFVSVSDGACCGGEAAAPLCLRTLRDRCGAVAGSLRLRPNYHTIGSLPTERRYSLAREKWRQPKNPR